MQLYNNGVSSMAACAVLVTWCRMFTAKLLCKNGRLNRSPSDVNTSTAAPARQNDTARYVSWLSR